MNKLPKKFVDRISSTIKKYQKISQSQQRSDVAEADTVTLVKDILADVFGYDKYEELTSEHQIKSTYCDLAVKLSGKLRILIEVKSAGSSLADNHLRQVIDYGAHQGIHWVILTNAVEWRLVRIYVANQISHEDVCRFNLAEVNPKSQDHLQQLFLFAKEGLSADAMDIFHQHSQLFNKFIVASIIKSDAVVGSIRRELRRIFPDLKIGNENLVALLDNEVIKREAIEGEKAKDANSRIRRAISKLEKAKAKSASTTSLPMSA